MINNENLKFVMNFINSVPQKRVDFTIILKDIMDKYPNPFDLFCQIFNLSTKFVASGGYKKNIIVQKILYQRAYTLQDPNGEIHTKLVGNTYLRIKIPPKKVPEIKTIGHLIEEYFTKEITKFKINIEKIGDWRIRDLEGKYRCDFILPIFILLNDVICEPVYTKENDSKIQNSKIIRNNSNQLCIKGKNNFLLSIFKDTIAIEIVVPDDTIIFQLIIDK